MTPEERNEEREKLSIEELMAIIAADGTKTQLDQAIEDGELTQEEADKILSYVASEDQEEQKRLMEEMLETIIAIPNHDSAENNKKAWGTIKTDLAKQVTDLQKLMGEAQKTVDTYQKRIDELEAQKEQQGKLPRAAKTQFRTSHDQLKINQAKLSKLTLQYNTAALIHAHAKTQEAQERGRAFDETTKPLRDALSHGFQGVIEKANALIEQVREWGTSLSQKKDAFDIAHETKNFGASRVDDFFNRLSLNEAKREVKALNKTKQQIDQLEQKILKKANQRQLDNQRKELGMGSFVLNAFSKGEKIERPALPEITDVNVALAQFEKDSLKKTYLKLCEVRDQHEAAVQQALSQVAQNIVERRDAINQKVQDIAARANNGEFGYTERAEAYLHEAGENLRAASGNTIFDRDDLDPELLKFMDENKYDAFFDHEASFSEDLLTYGEAPAEDLDEETLEEDLDRG